MTGSLVGRERECAQIDAALARGVPGVAAVLVEGAAGIGKTAVLSQIVAAHNGLVLAAHPAESEAAFTFAVLGDLLEQLPAHAVTDLPGPQQGALDAALLRAGDGVPPNGRLVGTALRTALSRVATETSVLIVIDDAQWADRASTTALGFALRRLDTPIGLLAAVRTDQTNPELPTLLAGLADPPLRVWLGPLNVAALFHVIRDRTGLVFPRPALGRIAEASGGNPLYAVELARALHDHGAAPAPGEPLPVPDTLEALIDARLAGVPAGWRAALLLIALAHDPTVDLLTAALGDDPQGPDPADLEAIVASGLVARRGGRLRFTHPLFATGTVARATPVERCDAHRRLAEIDTDPERRARHLALAAGGRPDADVAAALAAASASAGRRGAAEAAAELMELAWRASPDPRERQTLAWRLHHVELVNRSGDTPTARRLLDELIDDSPPGPTRAAALETFARLMCFGVGAAEAARRCDEALAEAGDDLRLLARVYATRSCVEYDDTAAGVAYGERALALLEALPDPDPVVFAQAVMGYMAHLAYRGDPFPTALIERALEYERRAPGPDVSDRLGAAYGSQLKYAGRLAEARGYLLAGYQAALDEGDEGSLASAASHLPQLELWAGNWPEAERWAYECLTLAERSGQAPHQISALGQLVQVHAHQGRFTEALDEAGRAFALIGSSGDDWQAGPLHGSVGFVHLATGEIDLAVEHLALAERLGTSSEVTRPLRTTRAYAEALLRAGRLAEADEVARALEANARRTAHHDHLGGALTCRALVAAAEQRLDAAIELIDAALAAHDLGEEPFARARALVARGQILRRRGERRAAVDALDGAEEAFLALGAPTFAAQAAEERARIPVRRKAGPGLTDGEQRVAELAASGLSNRQIAAELFLSSNTVEATLTRVYAKLGVRSRAALAARAAPAP